MKKEYKYHYVYRITNIITDYHYYGSKSCNELPKDNIGKKYFSTSGNKLFIQDQKNNPLDYKYKVIKIFETCREDAIELEIILHKKFDVKNHPKFINKANQTSKLFDITGTNQQKGFVAIWDLRTETIKKVPVSEYKNNDDYVSLHKDKISVLDIRDGMTKSIKY